jgi:hypothetical protein
MDEKKSLIVVNELDSAAGIEIYYYQGDEIKCECQLVKSVERVYPVEYDIYQVIVFYDRRFHHITRELLDKKIKSIDFPYFSVKLTHNKSTTLLTLEHYPDE